jgi:DNA-binding HxlR family transcriptional regulator
MEECSPYWKVKPVSSSLKETIDELAELAGVSAEALLKVAGLLNIIALLERPRTGEVRRNHEAQVINALSAEPVMSFSELEKKLGLPGEELRKTVARLVDKGMLHTAEDPGWGTLVAVDSNGTLRLSDLKDRDRRRAIINWYANRHKSLSYRAVHDINKQILKQKVKRKKPSTKDRVLEALRSGVKARVQLLALGINEASLDWALRELLKAGTIKKTGRGFYEVQG